MSGRRRHIILLSLRWLNNDAPPSVSDPGGLRDGDFSDFREPRTVVAGPHKILPRLWPAHAPNHNNIAYLPVTRYHVGSYLYLCRIPTCGRRRVTFFLNDRPRVKGQIVIVVVVVVRVVNLRVRLCI